MEKDFLVVGDCFDEAERVLQRSDPAFMDFGRITVDVLSRLAFGLLPVFAAFVASLVHLSSLLDSDVQGDGLFGAFHLSQIELDLDDSNNFLLLETTKKIQTNVNLPRHPNVGCCGCRTPLRGTERAP